MPLQFKGKSSPGVLYVKPGGFLVKIVTPESLFVEVEVVETALDTCAGLTSSDPAIVSPIYLKRTTVTSKVYEFYALNAGTVKLEASIFLGGKVYSLDVTVESRRLVGKTILKLGSKRGAPMAVMPVIPVEKINMAKLHVPKGRPPGKIIDDIKSKGPFGHLFFSCHRRKPMILDLDHTAPTATTGFEAADASYFKGLHGQVHTIWFSGCMVLLDAAGHYFAREVARLADCWVVAAMMAVPTMGTTGLDEIEAFTESTCMVYPPGSPTTISENDFFLNRDKRDFKIARLGTTPIGR
jgi:hypothetical protein